MRGRTIKYELAGLEVELVKILRVYVLIIWGAKSVGRINFAKFHFFLLLLIG